MEEDRDITDIRSFPLFVEQTERSAARRSPQPNVATEHENLIVLRTPHPKSGRAASDRTSDTSSDTASVRSDSQSLRERIVVAPIFGLQLDGDILDPMEALKKWQTTIKPFAPNQSSAQLLHLEINNVFRSVFPGSRGKEILKMYAYNKWRNDFLIYKVPAFRSWRNQYCNSVSWFLSSTM